MHSRSGVAADRRRERDASPGPTSGRVAARGSASVACFVLGLLFAGVAAMFAHGAMFEVRCIALVEGALFWPMSLLGRRGGTAGRLARFVLVAVTAATAVLAALLWTCESQGDRCAPWLLTSALLFVAAVVAAPPASHAATVAARRAKVRPLREWDAEKERAADRLCGALVAGAVVVALSMLAWDPGFFVLWHRGAWNWSSTSLGRLVLSDPAWTAAFAATLGAPAWFAAWRRKALPNGRTLGLVLSAAAAAAPALCAAVAASSSGAEIEGAWWMLILPGALCAAAFARASEPLDPERPDDLAVRSLLRRHRKSFPDAAR